MASLKSRFFSGLQGPLFSCIPAKPQYVLLFPEYGNSVELPQLCSCSSFLNVLLISVWANNFTSSLWTGSELLDESFLTSSLFSPVL